MINWFNIPDEGLSNGGLFEVKELEVTENGTYETKGEMYNKVTVNVEGGGGSSDLSTAEITFSNINGTAFVAMSRIINTPLDALLPLQNEVTDGTYTIVLYKGKTLIHLDFTGVEGNVTTSGNIELLESDTYLVTGDCTITIS